METKSDVESSSLTAIIDPPSAARVYPAPLPGRKALSETSAKLVKFLQIVGDDPNVNKALRTLGYSDAVHERGWMLVRGAGAARESRAVEPSGNVKAISYLEGWCALHFRRAQAILKYDYPAQEEYVFENVRIPRGPEAILTLGTFLGRLDDLESSPNRKATRTIDHESLEGLASVGITADERKRIAALVTIAETCGPREASAPNDSARLQSRLAAHAFFSKWSELARTVITNRTVLISMGIGKRRSRGAASSAPALPAATSTARAAQLPAAGANHEQRLVTLLL